MSDTTHPPTVTPALAADLRNRLLALGFDAVRFTQIESEEEITRQRLGVRQSSAALDFENQTKESGTRVPHSKTLSRRSSPPAAALRAWLDAGHHADMAWLERTYEKRNNPALVLPRAPTLIMLGVNYNPPSMECGDLSPLSTAGLVPPPPDSSRDNHGASCGLTSQPVQSGDKSPHSINSTRPTPLWARYAHYADYHDTLQPALARAGRILEEQLAIAPDDYRCYADTGPILERFWAERAGLGFIGKNAMLISRDHGNWLFLAAILVRAQIPPDAPLATTPLAAAPPAPPRFRHCGKCTRCQAACPTGALVRPGVVDSRLCIAYHTIENKGIIPRDLREKIGPRIYGCDACAEVCPWNRFAKTPHSPLLDPRPAQTLSQLPLLEILTLTPEKFAAIFHKTPIKRLKLPGLLRNACIVAGNTCAHTHDSAHMHDNECAHAHDNTHDSDSERERTATLAALVTLAAHPSPQVRIHAIWAVHKLAAPARAAELLRTPRAAERDPAVLREYEP